MRMVEAVANSRLVRAHDWLFVWRLASMAALFLSCVPLCFCVDIVSWLWVEFLMRSFLSGASHGA